MGIPIINIRWSYPCNGESLTWEDLFCLQGETAKIRLSYFCNGWIPTTGKTVFCQQGENQSLTHWGRATHICVSNLTIIASDNGLSPGRRQAIIWTSGGILLIKPLGTKFSEILVEIITFSFKKMRLKVSSAKWRPCCLRLNVLNSRTFLYNMVYHNIILYIAGLVQDCRLQ